MKTQATYPHKRLQKKFFASLKDIFVKNTMHGKKPVWPNADWPIITNTHTKEECPDETPKL